MSDLVGNPEDRFSRVEAHFIQLIFYIPECPNTQSDRNKMSVGLGKSHLLRLR